MNDWIDDLILTCTRDPETNSHFAPENGWLEYDIVSFLGPGLFSGANC